MTEPYVLTLTEEEIGLLIYDDLEGFTAVTGETIFDQSRWSTYYEKVFKRDSDGTFWEATWGRGSTESQDNGLEDPEVHQVWPEEVTTTVYNRVPPAPKGD